MTARLRLTGVTCLFRGGAGIRDIDLTVRPGEIHALVGLNGAGKTTLMRAALGMLRPAAGRVELDGVELDRLPSSAWGGVGHLVETPFAYPELTARANLILAARLHGAGRHSAAVADAAIDEFRLGAFRDVAARRLSLGNRQRVGIAAALQHAPALVVLDEPSNALDPAGVILVREALVRRAAASAGILVSSHHLDEVARVADRITLVNRGRVIGALAPSAPDLERALFDAVHADDLATGADP